MAESGFPGANMKGSLENTTMPKNGMTEDELIDICKSNVIIGASLNGGCSDETMWKREAVGKAAMEGDGALGGRTLAERGGASPGMRAAFRQAMAGRPGQAG